MSKFKSQDDNINSFDVSLKGSEYQLAQDVAAYKDYAEQSRIIESEMSGVKKMSRTFKPFCVLPDIVAIDILTKYNIDVHSPSFGSDPAEVNRFRNIMMTEYKALLTSNTTGNAAIIT